MTRVYIDIQPGVMEQTIFINKKDDIRAPMKTFTCPIQKIATFLLSQKGYIDEIHMTDSPYSRKIEQEIRNKAASFNKNAEIRFIYSKGE